MYRSWIILIGVIATVILAFNFWFIDHAKNALSEIVRQKSKGKLSLTMDEFKFNWIKNKIELSSAIFKTTDTTNPAIYRVTVKKMTLKVRGFLPLLIRKRLLIDSIHLYTPAFTLTKLDNERRALVDSLANIDTVKRDADTTLSVAQEMGKISNSINDAINELKIDRFLLDNGSLTMVDKTKPRQMPFHVDKITIRLAGLQVDSTTSRKSIERNGKIPFTDEIYIQTHDQDMVFPGNSHRLSFKQFRFTLMNKRVEFDSCTIRGNKNDSSSGAFKVYFDKLALTNINFDTLYHAEVIKADSVFCDNADVLVNIDGTKKKDKSNDKSPKRIDDLIQLLFGDVMLNNVVVKNADIDINTIANGKSNQFTSKDNNFEIKGFSVRQNAAKPVNVDRFLMTLHNYKTQLQDGRYAIAFDSVRFLNDSIDLNKFSFKEFRHGKQISNIQMPKFELRGLSWESLLFDNIFSAENALFYKPDIEYSITSNGRKKRTKGAKSIFDILNNIGEMMNLGSMSIIDGNIIMHLKQGGIFTIKNTNLSVLPDLLTESKKVKNIQHSIKLFNFSEGLYQNKDSRARIKDVALDQGKGLKIASADIQGKGIKIRAEKIGVVDLILDSRSKDIALTGVNWGKADVAVHKEESDKKSNKKSLTGFHLKDIEGRNTTLNMQLNGKEIAGQINLLVIGEAYKKASADMIVQGLKIDGKDLSMKQPGKLFSIDEMQINDQTNSLFKNFTFQSQNKYDTIDIKIPEITIIPDITKIINGDITLNKIILSDAIIKGYFGKKDSATQQQEPQKAPQLFLGDVVLERPHLQVQFVSKKNETTSLTWEGEKMESYLRLKNFTSTDKKLLNVDEAQIYLTNFEFLNKTNGVRYATNDNKLNIVLNNVEAVKNDEKKVDWNTLLSIISIDKLFFDSLGKNNAALRLDKGEVRNIYLDSRYLKNTGSLIGKNTKIDIANLTGTFATANNTLFWNNLSFKNGFFSIDSFATVPNQSLEDYMVKKAFDADYTRLATGSVKSGPIDIERYGNDSILTIGGIAANGVHLFIYKDKSQDTDPVTDEKELTKEKPLPTLQIIGLPIKLMIDSVGVKNMDVEYWEQNAKTKAIGKIPVSGMSAQMFNIKNFDLQPDDSLFIYADAQVINELHTRLQLKQSYTDSLGNFSLAIQTGPLELAKWNSVLHALVGVQIGKGYLDSLSLQARGNNDYSKGYIQMYYSGLKAKIMSRKNPEKQTTFNKMVSWVANLILRNNSHGKPYLAFFERWKDRSAVNFVIKTLLSGVKTNVGVPGAKKQERKFMQKLKQKEEENNLPPGTLEIQ